MDISHNNLRYEDCKLISEESKKNRTILGFHVEGNEMEIDPQGFIHPLVKKPRNYYSKSQLSFDENYKDLSKLLNNPINNIKNDNNCWICQHWREVEFILDINIKDIKPKYILIKIHFDFEDYAPCDMFLKNNKFRLIKMCPPGKIKYFITFDGNPIKNCYNKYDYKIKEFEKPIKYIFDNNFIKQYNNIKTMLINSTNATKNINQIDEKNLSIQEDLRDKNDKLISKVINIDNYGIRNIEENNKVITKNYENALNYCIPRPKDPSLILKRKLQWNFNDSIWSCCNYHYEGETDETINKIFDFDFIRNEYNLKILFTKVADLYTAKEIIKEKYRNIIECYIALSSYSGSTLWQITSSTLEDWLGKKCNFLDKNIYTIKNLDKILDVICHNKSDYEDRNKYNSFPSDKSSLIRHNFMSLIIHISIDKYMNIRREVKEPFDAL